MIERLIIERLKSARHRVSEIERHEVKRQEAEVIRHIGQRRTR
jgi:hypothetical protein